MWCGAIVGRNETREASVVSSEPLYNNPNHPLPPRKGLLNYETASIALRITIHFVLWVNRLTEMISTQLILYPRRARVAVGSVLMVAFVAASMHPAKALLFDTITNSVEAGTAGWLANSMLLADNIFYALGGSVILYNVIAHFMQHDSVKGLFQTLMRTCLALSLPWALMQLAPTTVGQVFCFAQAINADITGGGGACAGDPGASPDQLFLLGANIGIGLVQHVFNLVLASRPAFNPANIAGSLAFDFTQFAVDGLFIVLSLLLCIIMIFVFLFIAVELIMAYLQTYFAIPLGAWALGFLAVPQTGIASGYVGMLLRTVVRFVAVLAVVTFAQNVGNQWLAQINGIAGGWNNIPPNANVVDLGAMRVILETALSALGLLYIVVNLPKMAEAAMTGTPVLTGGNAVMGGIGLASTVAGGGVGAAGMGLFGAGAGAAMGAARTGTIEGALGGAAGGGARGAWQGASSGAPRGSAAGRAINRVIAGMRNH
jgi:hypothetical protein